MHISELGQNMYIVSVDESNNLHSTNSNALNDFAQTQVLTYGGLNTDCLADILERENYPVEIEELCPEDDDSLELRMPQVWYLNRGEHAFSIPAYYVYLQLKELARDGSIFTKNTAINQDFGKVGMIELYLKENLEPFLESHEMHYFGTPATLTECMRVLEGWDVERIPRLKHYVKYASYIQEWARKNVASYDESQWHLGKEESLKIFQEERTTNVREAIKQFWKRYLLHKPTLIEDDDVEIDIINANFSRLKQPDFVIVGEDFLDLKHPYNPEMHSESVQFHYFSGIDDVVLGCNVNPNDRASKTAELAQRKYPQAKIIQMQYENRTKRFKLAKTDELKYSNNDEMFYIANAIQDMR